MRCVTGCARRPAPANFKLVVFYDDPLPQDVEGVDYDLKGWST
jgi:hypothetical protein